MKIRLEGAQGKNHARTQETFHLSCSVHSPQVERFRAKIFATYFPAHAHDGYVVGVVHRGVQEFSCQGDTHYAKAGSVLFLNPEEIHSAKAADQNGVTYQTLHIPAPMIEEIGGANFRFRQPVLHAPRLARQLAWEFSQLDSAEIENYWFKVLSAIIDTLVRAQIQLPERLRIANDKRIGQLLEYVEENIVLPLNLRSLADQVNISQQHLIRCFKGALGVTPRDYIQARRIALAKRMLKDHSPSEVAAFTGYVDQSHLTRWLKNCYGTTPSIYRNQLQNKKLGNQKSYEMSEKDFELVG